ncbi:MAG: 5'/3'-nucleotidase SurE [Chloroflexi bacterium]|nr:5'/3'-nucleotidase SurE [Chloroflexota bacterium]MCY4246812.1 5'/3'-nucleotidase SurE [Chloroflexota bacterium]
MSQPTILFTNDDGIDSPGLWAAVAAFRGCGRLLVAAPREQQSGMGRSMPHYSEGRIFPYTPPGDFGDCLAYAVDGTPAQAVQHAVLELADQQQPALLVSGINYGENTGNGVTISGTVGAALEGASFGILSIAVSLQTPTDLHLTHSDAVDFRSAAVWTRRFGEWLIDHAALPDDVDALKIDVPWDATAATDWRLTRLSRRRVYFPTRPERLALSDPAKLGYHYHADPNLAEPDSDVYVLLHEGLVSVTPISLDMTSRTDMFRLRQILLDREAYGV